MLQISIKIGCVLLAMYIVIFVIFSLLYSLNYWLRNDKKAKIFNAIPGPKLLPIFGNGLYFLGSNVVLFYKMRGLLNKYKNICRIVAFHKRTILIYNPQDIEIILSSTKYLKKNITYRFLKPWLNEGLITSTGNKWQHRRKLLTPAFHFNILKSFCKTLLDQSDILINILQKTEGREVDLLPYIRRFALNSITETAMGTSFQYDDSTVVKYENALHYVGDMLVYRMAKIWFYINSIFYMTEKGRRYKKELEVLHSITTNIIRERRQQRILSGDKYSVEDFTGESGNKSKRRVNMLDLLLTAESEGLIDEDGIREEVDTFLFAGHDTVTMAVVFCLMLLANNEKEQKLAADEVDRVLGESKRNITIEDLNEMRYLERCIKESLRMYPSAVVVGRELEEDVQLKDYLIPGDTSCLIHIYDLHRNPQIYPNPEKFDPDRFLSSNMSKRHPFAYIPFSAGPRNCIGQKLAILEEKAVISSILRNFKLLPVTRPEDLIFTLDMLLRTRDPIKIKFVSKY